ncbi:MAG: NAD-dependent epimerase/dehydratase family protein, partial [Methylobacter sp.]
MSTGITLVTGATGHLGANLVRRLLAEGEQVRVMMRSERDNGALDGLDVERVFADLRNSKEVSAAVRGCARVYHCAALVSTIEGNAAHKREIFDTNVRGTIHILKAAERHGIDKVVVSGSLSATGYEADRSSHEGMPFYPFDRHLPYGFTKHLTEHECLKAHA